MNKEIMDYVSLMNEPIKLYKYIRKTICDVSILRITIKDTSDLDFLGIGIIAIRVCLRTENSVHSQFCISIHLYIVFDYWVTHNSKFLICPLF